MSKIIIYNSKTGFTEKYAKWLGEDLGIPTISFKEVKNQDLRHYDTVIYGASILAGMIRGLGEIKKMNLKNLVVFAVGFTVESKEYENTLIKNNNVDSKLFYLRGGVDFDKLSFFSKFIFKNASKQTVSVDMTSKNYLAPIEDYIKTL